MYLPWLLILIGLAVAIKVVAIIVAASHSKGVAGIKNIPEVPSRTTWNQPTRADLKMVVSAYELVDRALTDRQSSSGPSSMIEEARQEASQLVKQAYNISAQRQNLEEAIRQGRMKEAEAELQRQKLQSAQGPVRTAIENSLVTYQAIQDQTDRMEAQSIDGESKLNEIAAALTELHAQLQLSTQSNDQPDDLRQTLSNMKSLTSALEESQQIEVGNQKP